MFVLLIHFHDSNDSVVWIYNALADFLSTSSVKDWEEAVKISDYNYEFLYYFFLS